METERHFFIVKKHDSLAHRKTMESSTIECKNAFFELPLRFTQMIVCVCPLPFVSGVNDLHIFLFIFIQDRLLFSLISKKSGDMNSVTTRGSQQTGTLTNDWFATKCTN